jgi:hypothetical protein
MALALGDSYATAAELKGYADHMTDTVDDTQITQVLDLASRAIDHHCERQFNTASSATARVYHPDSWCTASVHDFSTTVGLVVATDGGDDGTYETTIASTSYQLEPLNGIVGGEAGWPYSRIRLVGTTFPTCSVRPSLQVTALWGWALVPAAIKVACIYLALEALKLKGAPFGVASFDQFGPIRVRDNPKVMAMIAPYRLMPILVA